MALPPQPRLCLLTQRPGFPGYGFNLFAAKNKPGQYVGLVDEDSPAEAAGLKEDDRIVEVNGVNVNMENHKQVVGRIKAVVGETRLLVVDKACEEWHRERRVAVKDTLPYVIHLSSEKQGGQEGLEDQDVPVEGGSPDLEGVTAGSSSVLEGVATASSPSSQQSSSRSSVCSLPSVEAGDQYRTEINISVSWGEEGGNGGAGLEESRLAEQTQVGDNLITELQNNINQHESTLDIADQNETTVSDPIIQIKSSEDNLSWMIMDEEKSNKESNQEEVDTVPKDENISRKEGRHTLDLAGQEESPVTQDTRDLSWMVMDEEKRNQESSQEEVDTVQMDTNVTGTEGKPILDLAGQEESPLTEDTRDLSWIVMDEERRNIDSNQRDHTLVAKNEQVQELEQANHKYHSQGNEAEETKTGLLVSQGDEKTITVPIEDTTEGKEEPAELKEETDEANENAAEGKQDTTEVKEDTTKVKEDATEVKEDTSEVTVDTEVVTGLREETPEELETPQVSEDQNLPTNKLSIPPSPKEDTLSTSSSSSSSVRSSPSPSLVSSPSPPLMSSPSPPLVSSLDLTFSLTAREMRERLVSRRKRDPRMEDGMDFRKKHDIIQTL